VSRPLQRQKNLGVDNFKRQQARVELRPSDGLKAFLKISEKIKIQTAIFDVSPKGLCLFIPSTESIILKVDVVVDLEVKANDGKAYPVTGRICWKADFQGKGWRYGVEIVRKPFLRHPTNHSFLLPEYFPLTGATYKPYLFYERAVFRVLDVSQNFWTIKIFDSEILAFEGVEIDFYLNNSIGFNGPIRARIISLVETDEENAVTIYVYVGEIPQVLQEWIGQQLIFNCNISPEYVRALGFKVKSVSNGFKFRFVKTRTEYEDVLKLRFDAYREAGKVGDDKTFHDMAAPLDYLSRIIAVYHGDRIVGSVAISFPSDDNLILDTERAFKNGYPKKIPPKTQIIEISRLCTQMEYRKTDLLNRIFEYTYKSLNCGDRDYIITSTDAKLWPLYKKLGFKKTGMKYAHPYLSGIEHDVILGTRKTPDQAMGISPLAWNYLWRDMNEFLEEKGHLKLSPLQKIFVKMNRRLGRVLKINIKKRY
jgi:hypothetical protein